MMMNVSSASSASSSDKRREELQVAVPAPFRCPISMDVMKSPVSLCTGITYDRSSIEKWLALGNTTCPATMITLSSTRTIPNLTLRRLIHLWLSQNDSFRSPPAVCEPQLAEIFAGELDSESLSKVVGFVKESPEENSAFFGESNDAVCKLISFFAARSDEVEIGEQVVEVLVLISKENGVIERLNRLISSGGVGDPLPALARVLRKGTTESKLNAARILNQIAINVESRRKISETPTVLHELHALLSSSSSDAAAAGTETVLSSLLTIADMRPAKKELIRSGIVRTAGRILSSAASTPAAAEKTMALLEKLSTCTEGRAAIGEDGECVREMVRRLMKCSGAATAHGISALWSVCCLARDAGAQAAAEEANGLTKVLLVMQSDCSEYTRRMCVELVKILRVKSTTSNLSPYHSRTTHITPY